MTSSLEKARAKSAENRNALHPPKALPVIHLLRDIRVAKGITQGDLAARMGWDKRTLSQAELAKNTQTFQFVNDWANALGYELCLRPKGDK